MSEICRFIHAEKANYPIVLLCKVMKTGRSTYYAWVCGAGAREARQRADEALVHEITVIHLASRRNYGVPHIIAELRRHGKPRQSQAGRAGHAELRHLWEQPRGPAAAA
ncbi:hypothetical protein ABZX75_33915 [Streptomyces sp. NPDC003038]|uniref:hypothetical protein n=1 Tax=unclassified Streptomyces TaxID=2593676 RepID=UPI00339E07B4